jgi:hypothetical protein
MEDRDMVTPVVSSPAFTPVAEPDLRVSDAERDQAVAALGRHYQAGRLDQAEFDERMGAALSARTRRDLRRLLADLPPDGQLGEPGSTPATSRRNPLVPLLPLGIVAMFIFGGLAAGGHHHGAGGAPWPLPWLWIVIPIIVIRLRMASRRGQWR